MSSDGQPAIIDAATYQTSAGPGNAHISFDYPTRFIEAYEIQSVDAGGFAGFWASNRYLNLRMEGSVDYPGYDRLTRDYMALHNRGDSKNPSILNKRPTGSLGPVQPDTANAIGRSTVTFEGGGNNTVALITLTDRGGSALIRSRFQYVGGGSVIQMEGTFTAHNMSLEIAEGGSGVARTQTGKFIYLGKTYSVYGGRIFGRGAFRLYNQATNEYAGQGWMSWQPTVSVAQAIQKGNAQSTDRIIAWLQMPGTGYASGAVLTFTKSP